jgi:hypothetical protein
MAQTFTAHFSGIAFAAGKVMAGILNGHATEVIKIRRAGILNAQTVVVSGVACLLEVRAYRGTATLTGGTAVTAVSHDSTNTAPTTLTLSHNSTPGGTSNLLRRVWWSSDEPAASGATVDELECLVPLNIIWDAGYADANVQPLTLRQDESFVLYNASGAAGLVDIWIEFTKE